MNVSISIHAKSEKKFAPTVKCFAMRPDAISYFVLSLDAHHVDVYLTHEQMITLRDELSKAIYESPLKCADKDCEEAAVATCENDGSRFCADHGQVEHDREGGTNANGSPFGTHSVPSICDPCIERSRV